MKLTQYTTFDLDINTLSNDNLICLKALVENELTRRANVDLSLDLEEKVMARQNKLSAIKMYMHRVGGGLVAAKNAVKAFLEKRE